MLEILNRALPFGETIRSEDIERCQSIVKINVKNNRQVILTFRAYKTKANVYDSWFNLRNVYMTEDFTPSGQKIINKLVQLKKVKKLKNCPGRMMAKSMTKLMKVSQNVK